eukprot:693858-Pelagomonas_calceolata.AAC.1
MERITSGIQEPHKLVHATRIPEACVVRRGFEVAVIATNSCVDYMSLHEDSEDLHLCESSRCTVVRDDVTNSSSSLFDEFSCSAQVAPHFLLCGDYNTKIGGLSEASDAHGGLLTAYPALLKAR